MNELRIHTQINSRYRVFDASGQLPFSIVFGLCRHSPTDTDPRPLLLEIAGSVLDVPYALAHGLLTIHVQGSEDAKEWAEVDLSRLNNVAAKEDECLSLPSPVNRTEHWRDVFTQYQCPIDIDGQLASILEPGKKYRIRLASEDLGVKRFAYSDQKQFIESHGKPNHDAEETRLVKSKLTASNASFKVVKSLSWPPRIEIRMRLCASPHSSGSALADAGLSSSPALEVSVVNTGSESVTVQTRGHQHFLIPWGPFQPEPDSIDDHVRIIDAAPDRPPTSSLQVVDPATGKVVRGNEQRGTDALTDSNAGRRPKVEDVVTLKAGVPINRKIDTRALVDGLADGHYKLRTQARGCRWWYGEIGKENCEDGRVPAHLGGTTIPPLMLESQDEVELRISDGKIDQSM
ncbi:MAG: hypothetical protein LQ343_007612 [Gyalolechia ehrenbergii]|nr:MAG: hypothetical protein LQ343_007612 [Gyalolechia ehrenbergii]